ncbi:MAG: hypothetical protein MRZ90_02385 [Candidatus Gastranaerophilales bacterium]|nr:hypothetical protein [Candidatus Gastranaerophilales bacterium]
MDKNAIEELENYVNSMLDKENPGMIIKSKQNKFISELRANFVTALKGAANTNLKSSVIELLAQIKDPSFLDINDNEQLEFFAKIDDTDNNPIFIKRYARYILAKKAVDQNTKDQNLQNALFDSIVGIMMCYIDLDQNELVQKIKDILNLEEDKFKTLFLNQILKREIKEDVEANENTVALANNLILCWNFKNSLSVAYQNMIELVRDNNSLTNELQGYIMVIFGSELNEDACVNIFNRLIEVVKQCDKVNEQLYSS